MPNRTLVLVIGPSKGGKSMVAKMAADLLNTRHTDISEILIEKFAKHKKISPTEVLNNKEPYRDELFGYGLTKQRRDPAFFVKKALRKGDVVAGVRPRIEFKAVKDWFDIILWVGGRTEPGSTDPLSPEDADVVINNSGSIEKTKKQVVEALSDHRKALTSLAQSD